jgi:glycosyltransferase involved in cell wall biosynthesis
MTKRILFYSDSQWALGCIHSSLCTQLRALGWIANIKDWSKGYVISEFAEEASRYDYIVTLPFAGTSPLVHGYGIPREKIIIVAHDESDIQKLLSADGIDEFDRYANYGVVSDSLACSSIALGVRRVPFIVRLGVDIDKYLPNVSAQLSSVGYASAMLRETESGLERKRGPLAQACAEAAGLRFVPVNDKPFDRMPEYYASVDSLLMPSLQEGAGLPPLEAAAAGKLVIATPVGHFPRLANEGLGILAPLEPRAFQRFAVEKLIYYKNNAAAYVEKCAAIQAAAKQRDWQYTVEDWVECLSDAR